MESTEQNISQSSFSKRKKKYKNLNKLITLIKYKKKKSWNQLPSRIILYIVLIHSRMEVIYFRISTRTLWWSYTSNVGGCLWASSHTSLSLSHFFSAQDKQSKTAAQDIFTSVAYFCYLHGHLLSRSSFASILSVAHLYVPLAHPMLPLSYGVQLKGCPR